MIDPAKLDRLLDLIAAVMSRIDRLCAMVRADADWNEADHPRGQPENAGQFGPGGGKLGVAKGATSGGIPLTYDAESKAWRGEGADAERIKALAIPPGWTDVRIAADPDADLQALGKDAKGRAQYRYSAAFKASMTAKKFKRIDTLEAVAPELEKAARQAIADGDGTAAAVLLMMLTGMRPGSDKDTAAEKKAFGATNLRRRHVRVKGETVHYEFVGKKGVAISNKVADKHLADFIAANLSAPDDERLFSTDETRARAFIKKVCGGDYRSKDLRTRKANLMARELVSQIAPPTDAKERTKAVNHVADVVSSQLGNSRAMALSSYINPVVFDVWDEAMKSEKKADTQFRAPENSAAEMHRQSVAFREFADSISYVGGGQPIPATAEEIGDIDD